MSIKKAETPRRRWVVGIALLCLFEGGCAALGTAGHRERKSDSDVPSERESNSGTTLGTDPTSVKPGRTITPPSLGIDLSHWSIERKNTNNGVFQA
ncbi:hypothetical protein SAMN05444166_6866 [Singulisphaera sp. GP187]|nr:hypothetical protein SAMN05444166_6866 [Singulisphaera sp. GP187]